MALDRLTRITTSGIEDGVILTNPTIVGAATATSFSGDITGDVTGEINSVKFDTNSSGVVVSGIITATTFQGGTFVGDGAGLVGVTASGSGVNVSNSDSIVGVAGTINFGTGIDVSPVSAGVVTTTVSSVTVGTGATINGTTNTITALTNSEERLRIRSDGDVFIGTPAHDLESNLGSRKRLAVCDTTNGALLHLRGQSPAIFFDQSSGNIGKIFLDSVDFAIQSGTPASEGTERLRITSAGNVGVFNAVAQAYTNEGTYTTKLRVGSDTLTSNQASAIQIGGRDSTGSGTIGAIEFFNHRDDDIIAQIICKRDLSSSSKLSAGKLDFYTDDGDGNLNKHLAIDANGTINAGKQLRLSSDGIMYVENPDAVTQAKFGTINGSLFEDREHVIFVYGHSTSDYTLIRGCNDADGTPVFDAYVNGSRSIEIEADGGVNSQGAYTNISDQRLKENIIDSPSQWDDIKVLKVRKFNFTEASGYPMNTKIGFIAQEVEETSPGLVKTRYEYDEEGQEIADSDMKVVKTSVITVKAVKALQEAMARIEVLESRLNAAGIAT